MKKRVLGLLFLFVSLGLSVRAEGRIVESFNAGWFFKKAPASNELAVNVPKWESGWKAVETLKVWEPLLKCM